MEYQKEYSKLNYQILNGVQVINTTNNINNPQNNEIINLDQNKIFNRPLQTLNDTGENIRSQQIFITKYNCVNY
jgi:hypothetical protein